MEDMDSEKTCGALLHVECVGALNKKNCKTCGRTKAWKRERGKWVVFVLRLGRSCARKRLRVKKRRVGRENDSWFVEVKRDGSTNGAWREPETALSFAKRAELSLDSDSSGETGACVMQSSENVFH